MKKALINISYIIGVILLLTFTSKAQLSPLNLGTLKPRDSIVIYYDVTINSGAGTSVTNQGNITGTGINLVTDDPDTGVPNDATVTLLNVYALPVRLVDVNAVAKNGVIELSWKVSQEENMKTYEVERSSNGNSYTKIGQVAARNLAAANYTFTDNTPSAGVNFYRLRMVDEQGAKYSLVVRVDMSGRSTGVKVYPNPSVNGWVTLQLNNMSKGSYQLLLYNNLGQVVYKKTLQHEGGSSTKNISLPAKLSKGMYSIKIMNEGVLLNQQLMVQ